MKSIYFICIHCETPFAVNVPDELYEEYKSSQYATQVLFEWFEENGYGECPHKGCDGSLIDYWDLADWRKQGRDQERFR